MQKLYLCGLLLLGGKKNGSLAKAAGCVATILKSPNT